MKIPTPIKASAIVNTMILLMSFLAAGQKLLNSLKTGNILDPNTSGPFVSVCALSVVLLAPILLIIWRNKFVYYWNILSSILLLVTVVFSSFQIYKNTHGIQIFIAYSIPFCLLIWLIIELIKNTSIKEFIGVNPFSKSYIKH
jgi:hypothetical protein